MLTSVLIYRSAIRSDIYSFDFEVHFQDSKIFPVTALYKNSILQPGDSKFCNSYIVFCFTNDSLKQFNLVYILPTKYAKLITLFNHFFINTVL